VSAFPCRIGQGFDVHQLVPDRPLILGGAEIEHHLGLKGHSDADVLIHAICDAVLGAFALGDLGKWFPDNDPKYKNIDSTLLLKEILQSDELSDWQLVNLDTTIVAQQPKLAPHVDNMRQNLASLFQSDISQVSVKATTSEKLGFTGREEGISAQAIVLFSKS
jgi:2-C-methyl-D-erythritol 2,4-cyclodiphosphate synthase